MTPKSSIVTVKPESVTIFNPPAGPSEIAGCGCETEGGDGFWDMFTNKDGLWNLSDNANLAAGGFLLAMPAAAPIALALADLAAAGAAANECFGGGGFDEECRGAIGKFATSVVGAAAIARAYDLTTRGGRALAGVVSNSIADATAMLVNLVRNAGGPESEMAPLPFEAGDGSLRPGRTA